LIHAKTDRVTDNHRSCGEQPKVIEEYAGRVNSGDVKASVARMVFPHR
jgi:hypothetical protein